MRNRDRLKDGSKLGQQKFQRLRIHRLPRPWQCKEGNRQIPWKTIPRQKPHPRCCHVSPKEGIPSPRSELQPRRSGELIVYSFCRIINYNSLMKWSAKVDDRTKEKIEMLLKEFDRFIVDSHEGGTSVEDKSIIKEWKNFKSVIEKDPTDVESLHSYINSIQD